MLPLASPVHDFSPASFKTGAIPDLLYSVAVFVNVRDSTDSYPNRRGFPPAGAAFSMPAATSRGPFRRRRPLFRLAICSTRSFRLATPRRGNNEGRAVDRQPSTISESHPARIRLRACARRPLNPVSCRIKPSPPAPQKPLPCATAPATPPRRPTPTSPRTSSSLLAD